MVIITLEGTQPLYYGRNSQEEDWAEAVAAVVYPGRGKPGDQHNFKQVWEEGQKGGCYRQVGMDQTRRSYVYQQAQFVTTNVNNHRRFYGAP